MTHPPTQKRIVILGAGFGGLTLATDLDALASTGKIAATIVDRKAQFQMGFASQWVLAGRRGPEEGCRDYAALKARHARFLQDDVIAIDTSARTVKTTTALLDYDYLVIALGVEMAPELVPGLPGVGHDLCSMESVLQMKAALEKMAGGTAVIMISSLPFKCGPSPYEYGLIIDELLRKRGTRQQVRLILTTPEPQPMPVAGKTVGDGIKAMLAQRGIDYRPLHKPTAVDGKTRRITYENGAQLVFDLLGAVLPQRAPKVVRDAHLTDASGFVPADLMSFQIAVPNVYAIGDCAALKLADGKPHPKAGSFAEAQATALAKQLAAQALGRGELARYSGMGLCFVDAGGDAAAAAEANLFAPGGPQFVLTPPTKNGLDRKSQFEAERLARWFL